MLSFIFLCWQWDVKLTTGPTWWASFLCFLSSLKHKQTSFVDYLGHIWDSTAKNKKKIYEIHANINKLLVTWLRPWLLHNGPGPLQPRLWPLYIPSRTGWLAFPFPVEQVFHHSHLLHMISLQYLHIPSRTGCHPILYKIIYNILTFSVE